MQIKIGFEKITWGKLPEYLVSDWVTRCGKEVLTFDILSRTLMMCNFNSGYNLFIHYLVCFSFNVWIPNGELDISFIS